MLKYLKEITLKSAAVTIMLVAAFFSSQFLIRLLLLNSKGLDFQLYDFRGVLCDLAIATLFALSAAQIARLWSRAWIALLPLWGIVNYGVYEHIRALDALPSLSNAGYLLDSTFLTGSAMHLSNVLLLLVLLVVPGLVLWFFFRASPPSYKPSLFIILAIIFVPVHFIWGESIEAPLWRQSNFIYSNIARNSSTFNGERGARRTNAPSGAGIDLSGTPVVKLGNRGANVLIVMLEGVSGVYLNSVALKHGIDSFVKMPKLDAIVKDAVVYSDFISNQRQTNRGEYAVLCGDYPNLTSGIPKMSISAKGDLHPRCLPQVLRREGYETVYMQAAPLGFMLKDAFMPKIGFSKVYGDEWFDKSYTRNMWGVDDLAFFERGVEVIRDLDKNARPWLLTMMTVGTHHPYIVPGSFSSSYDRDSFGNAIQYLDMAVESFYTKLKEEGLLENTLVIFTSDESVGLVNEPNDILKLLSQNWGLLAAIMPNGEKLVIDENFMQVDIAVSILDYLGYAGKRSVKRGRSVFRKYDKKRDIYFGNVLRKMLGTVDPIGDLYLCRDGFNYCRKFSFAGSRPLFSNELISVEDAAGSVERLSAVAELSDVSRQGRLREFEVALAIKKDVVIRKSEKQMIFGQQDIKIPGGSRIDIVLDIGVEGDGGGIKMRLVTYLEGDDMDREHDDTVLLPLVFVGDRFVLKTSYNTRKNIDYFETLLYATKEGEGKVSLKINEASLKVSPSKGKAATGELSKERELSINGSIYEWPE